jgi:hypothetical protein
MKRLLLWILVALTIRLFLKERKDMPSADAH